MKASHFYLPAAAFLLGLAIGSAAPILRTAEAQQPRGGGRDLVIVVKMGPSRWNGPVDPQAGALLSGYAQQGYYVGGVSGDAVVMQLMGR